jgi:hypothetical protein
MDGSNYYSHQNHDGSSYNFSYNSDQGQQQQQQQMQSNGYSNSQYVASTQGNQSANYDNGGKQYGHYQQQQMQPAQSHQHSYLSNGNNYGYSSQQAQSMGVYQNDVRRMSTGSHHSLPQSIDATYDFEHYNRRSSGDSSSYQQGVNNYEEPLCYTQEYCSLSPQT